MVQNAVQIHAIQTEPRDMCSPKHAQTMWKMIDFNKGHQMHAGEIMRTNCSTESLISEMCELLVLYKLHA